MTAILDYSSFEPNILVSGRIESPFTEKCALKNSAGSHCDYPGTNIEIFRVAMAYLNIHYNFASDKFAFSGYKDENGTWNGILGLIMKGQVAMASNLMRVSEDRLEIVDFSAPVTNYQMALLIKKPVRDEGSNFYFPFVALYDVNPLITCYGILLVFLWMLGFLTARVQTTGGTCWHVVLHKISLILNPPKRHKRTIQSSFPAIFFLQWEVALLIFTVYFDSIMETAVVTDSQDKLPFHNLESFIPLLKEGKFSLAIEQSATTYPKWSETERRSDPRGPIARMHSSLLKNPPHFHPNPADLLRALHHNPNLALYASKDRVVNLAAESCQLLKVDITDDVSRWLAFAVQKRSNLGKLLSAALYPSADSVSAMWDRVSRKYSRPIPCTDNAKSVSHATAFSLKQLQLLFLVLFVGNFAGIVALGIEVCGNYRRKVYSSQL